jgi:predicted TIM-barrel fold metal-dependent hydrolase
MDFIDAHAHLSSAPDAAVAWLREMKELGIGQSVVVAGGTVTPEELSKQMLLGGSRNVDVDNAGLLRSCTASTGRLIPFYFANPHRGAQPYLEEGRRFRGLKIGPAVHGVPFTDERITALAAAAEGFGHPVYLHCLARPGFDVAALVDLARRFPRVPFILGHAGIGNCDFLAVSLIESSKNIFFETSGGFTSVIELAVKRLGAQRVLFGTERPLQSARAELHKAQCLSLTDAEWAGVMGGNMKNLLEGFHA